MWAMQKEGKVKKEAWKIAVDVEFRYMIRLYFSDIEDRTSDVEFEVLINGMIAQVKNKDDENKIPCFRDYIVTMRGRRNTGKRDLSISLHSYDGFVDGYGHLAGFEVFKLTNSDNSLAGVNPLPPDHSSPSISSSMFHHRNAVTFIAVTMISLLYIVVHKPSARAERLCRRFSLTEIKLATRNFNDELFIGRGGFGEVYQGHIDRGQTTVAVKRLKSGSSQGAHEFLMEIETLSNLRHVNLVSLIGYCNERREMILVYDFMSRGTLSDLLYKRQRESIDSPSLTWNQRLSICIGAARGLDYLHTGNGVIHRDVKTSNILLDENFTPKVSDFGLAKHEDIINLQSHVSTRVKGTKGYLDPHYHHTSKLTRKTDTYAFGVVLFEVLCGKKAVEDERVLTLWARDKIKKGEVDEIVDLCLREEISQASRNTFIEIAERCLREDPEGRPTMSQVVQQLELAVDQQDNKKVLVLDETKIASDDIFPGTSDERGSVSRAQSPMTSSSGIRATGRKPLRNWPWEELWKRVKPPKKNDLLSEIWEELKKGLIKYDWDMIAAATNRFSDSNEIGRFRFGVVYQGRLNGRLIAVKKLSPSFRKPEIRELMKEINIIPKLHDRNIIRLLGYCIHGEKMLFVYELMEDGSLKPSKKNELLPEVWEESNMSLIDYEWDTIAAATNQFSDSSKIGEGGFGVVYKGLLMGDTVAVKRLRPSPKEYQIREFINEIVFLPNLQHRNIIRLHGCCTHREEKLLVYEFMENGSLDTFIVDEVQRRKILQWELRFKIIMGIARGLVYLQQDSGLRFIHKCVKLSNILLDTEMNPKISDFGVAVAQDYSNLETLETNMNPEISTAKAFAPLGIAAPFGCMALKYCVHGKCSFKSDVYGFGILILEIVSGMRANRQIRTDPSYLGCKRLLDYAWYLWSEGRVCDLVDESLVGAFSEEEALTCVQVGLLCTQENPDQWPEMSSVLKMLEGEELLVDPQQPSVNSGVASEFDDPL